MERREDILEEYVQLDSLYFITYPILSRVQDLLDDPRVSHQIKKYCTARDCCLIRRNLQCAL